jgi:hypothetical protein
MDTDGEKAIPEVRAARTRQHHRSARESRFVHDGGRRQFEIHQAVVAHISQQMGPPAQRELLHLLIAGSDTVSLLAPAAM